MSGLESQSNEVEDADNPDIEPRLTTDENIDAPIKPVSICYLKGVSLCISF